MSKPSALGNLPLPEQLRTLLNKYDKSCTGAWTPTWVCLVIWLVLLVASIALFDMYWNNIHAPVEEDPSLPTATTMPTPTRAAPNTIYMYVGCGIFTCSAVFMIAFIILVVRGNVCKAGRRFAREIMEQELRAEGYLMDPVKMSAVTSEQWSVFAERIGNKITERLKDRQIQRAVVASLVAPPYPAAYHGYHGHWRFGRRY